MRPNTEVSVLRGQRVEDDFLDTQDVWTRIGTGVPASIFNAAVSRTDLRNSSSTTVSCRVPGCTDVVIGDRVLDECTNEGYLVTLVTQTRLQNQQKLLEMTKL